MINRWRKFMVGTGKARAGFSGLVDTSTFSIAGVSNAGTAETVLFNALLKANSLYKNGQSIRVTVLGKLAANGNGKTIRLYLGGTGGYKIVDSGLVTDNGTSFRVACEIIRTGSKTQMSIAYVESGTAFKALTTLTTGTQDDTTDLNITLTGQSDTASGDVTANGILVEALTQ